MPSPKYQPNLEGIISRLDAATTAKRRGLSPQQRNALWQEVYRHAPADLQFLLTELHILREQLASVSQALKAVQESAEYGRKDSQ